MREQVVVTRTLCRAFAWENILDFTGPRSKNGWSADKEEKSVSRHQQGYIFRKGRNWYGRWWDDVMVDGEVLRKQRCEKLVEVSDRYRSKADVRPLLADKLRPINEGKARPESTLPVAKFVDDYYMPFVQENYKPSTIAGYRNLWESYLSARLDKIVLRDFRTVDAANLPEDTHAATPDEVLAIMDALDKAGEQKARAAVALMFFAGLRPGEARGVCWEDYDGKRLVIRQSIWHTHTTAPKTAGSAKPVPVIEPLGGILAALREKDGNPIAGPILRGPSGKPLDLHNLGNRVVIPTLKRCGSCQQSKSEHGKADHDFQLDESLPKWHGWYSLRRGVATAVADLSNSLAAKGLLRHSSVSTTERHYIKDVPESTLQAMKMLETLCNPCATSGEGKPI